MDRIATLSLFVAAALTVVPVALGTHCTNYRTSATLVSTSGYYVDGEVCPPGMCLWSVWVYEESNGIVGLQRGDSIVDDTCHGLIESDRIVA